MHFLPLSLPLPTNLLLAKEVKEETERWLKMHKNALIHTKMEYAYNYLSSLFYLILWGASVEFSLLLTCKEDPAVRVHLFAALWISLQGYCTTGHLSDFFPCRQSAFSAWHFLTARGMENKSPTSILHQNAQSVWDRKNVSACNKAQPLLFFMKPAGRRSLFIIYDCLLSASFSPPFLKAWPKSLSNWATDIHEPHSH